MAEGPAFEATYHGLCSKCESDIHPGQRIRKAGSAYRHDLCPDDVPEKPVNVCSQCHLAKPCFCDE